MIGVLLVYLELVIVKGVLQAFGYNWVLWFVLAALFAFIMAIVRDREEKE